jgi:histone H3/H4
MAKKKETPVLVVQSKVKEYLSGQGVRTSGELIESLNQSVAVILDAAAQRCKGNNRQTVKANDL